MMSLSLRNLALKKVKTFSLLENRFVSIDILLRLVHDHSTVDKEPLNSGIFQNCYLDTDVIGYVKSTYVKKITFDDQKLNVLYQFKYHGSINSEGGLKL